MVSNRQNQGFTVLELLAAMTVLIFIVLMMTRIFTETTTLWNRGAKNIQSAVEGRVIMDFIVKEMTQAIGDELVTFKLDSGGPSRQFTNGVEKVYGADVDAVCFVGMVQSGRPGNRRTGDQFAYFVTNMRNENSESITNRFRLVRARKTTAMYATGTNRENSAYRNEEWWKDFDMDFQETGTGTSLETIAENVAGFEVWAWSEVQNRYVSDFNSRANGNKLPLWVDIYLELLSESDSIRAAILWGENQAQGAEFISRNVKRYTTRVYFPNRGRF